MTTVTGDPAGLRAAARRLDDVADTLRRHRTQLSYVREDLMHGWQGSAAVHFQRAALGNAGDTREAATQLAAVAAATRSYATALDRALVADRTLTTRRRTLDERLRGLQRDIRLAADPVTVADQRRELATTVTQLRDCGDRIDDNLRDVQLARRRYAAALTAAAPSPTLWELAMRCGGLGPAYWAVFSKGSATYQLWKVSWAMRGQAPPAATSAAPAQIKASVAFLRGGPMGWLTKPWAKRIAGSRVGKGVGRFLPVVGAVDSARQGWGDVRRSRRYSGWRQWITFQSGMAQIGGSVAMLAPGEAQVVGAVAVTGASLVRSINVSYDRRKDTGSLWRGVARDQVLNERNCPGLLLGWELWQARPRFVDRWRANPDPPIVIRRDPPDDRARCGPVRPIPERWRGIIGGLPGTTGGLPPVEGPPGWRLPSLPRVLNAGAAG